MQLETMKRLVPICLALEVLIASLCFSVGGGVVGLQVVGSFALAFAALALGVLLRDCRTSDD